MTTHSPDDVTQCDEVIVLGIRRLGRLPGAARRRPRPLRRDVPRRRLPGARRDAEAGSASSSTNGPGTRCQLPADGTASVPHTPPRPPAVGGPVPPQPRGAGPQPPDPRHHARRTGPGHRHVRDPLPPRSVRPAGRSAGRRGHHLLARLRSLLLRPHLRPAADHHGDGGRAPRAPRGRRRRAVPAGQDGRAPTGSAGGHRRHGRRAARHGPAPRFRRGRHRGARRRPDARRRGRARPGAPDLRGRVRSVTGDAGPADALLPGRALRRGRAPGPGHGDRRSAHQRGDARPVGVRVARPDPRPADEVRRTGRAPLS